MRKQFFYAALAIAMVMSSCSKDNDPASTDPTGPTGPTVIDDTTPVAIQLGINSPSITATTRGTGTVGSTKTADNKWNEQTLGILMYKVASDNTETLATEVTDDATSATAYIFDGLTFKAPKSDATNQLVQIYNDKTAGILQAKYYPSSGKYAFYGYHIDDASYNTETTKTDTTFTVATKTISNIIIDGSQDLLAAVTAPIPTADPSLGQPYYGAVMGDTDWDTMAKQSFSAWSARRNVQPNLTFEHKLARLRFYVKAGGPEAADSIWNTTSSVWQKRDDVAVSGTNYSPAVTITQINVLGLDSIVDMQLSRAATGDQLTVPLTLNTNSKPATFSLKSATTDANGKLQALEPTFPKYDATVTASEATTGNKYYKASTPVGESLMFFPTGECESSIKLSIAVQQAVLDTYKLDGSGNMTEQTYILKKDILPYTLTAESIKKDGTAITKFEPGKSYDITIKVYEYTRIEITATLSSWTEGGSVEVAPGDSFTE